MGLVVALLLTTVPGQPPAREFLMKREALQHLPRLTAFWPQQEGFDILSDDYTLLLVPDSNYIFGTAQILIVRTWSDSGRIMLDDTLFTVDPFLVNGNPIQPLRIEDTLFFPLPAETTLVVIGYHGLSP